MVEWGMKSIEAVQAATITAAELMGWADSVGSLDPGRFADLVAASVIRSLTFASSSRSRL
jgi:imidazolonepropionase-like amidohydrolase